MKIIQSVLGPRSSLCKGKTWMYQIRLLAISSTILYERMDTCSVPSVETSSV